MKKKRIGEYKRKCKQRREVLPGFPWEGVFQSKEEIDAYFAGEEIQCLLCGKWFRQISTSHLLRVHEVTPDEYRQRYRLPWGRGLTGQMTHNKISRLAKQRLAEKSLQGEKDNLDRTSWRPRQPFLAYRKWQPKDYEAILTRMQEQHRSLADVCRDSDLPGQGAWRKFVKQRPEFAERVKAIYASWPYSVQGRVRRELSPQFRVDCQQLRNQGLSYQKIAEELGVDTDTVFLTFRRLASSLEDDPDEREFLESGEAK